MPFQRVAIVDRKEAATRLIHAIAETTRQDGVPRTAVALHLHAERGAAWVREADEAVDLGDGDDLDAAVADGRVAAALSTSGCDAAWSGWGLGAPMALARTCRQLGIVHLGADPALLERLLAPGAVDALASATGLARVTPDGASPAHRLVAVDVARDGVGDLHVLGIRDRTLRHGETVYVEEAPPADLRPDEEAALRDAARRVCEEARFTGVGRAELALGDGAPALVDLVAGIDAGHAATELTAGIDVVKLQLNLATGGLLGSAEPVPLGHAIWVWLGAVDPDAGHRPAGGRLASFRAPARPGVRVDLGAFEGDDLLAGDPTIAGVAGWGRTRDEARARLGRALADTTVIVEGADSNRAVLAAVLDHPDFRAATVDGGWLDRSMAAGAIAATERPDVALVWAAIDAYEIEHDADRLRFLASAARGRPAVAAGTGHTVELALHDRAWRFTVLRTGPSSYRVRSGPRAVDVQAERLGPHQGRLRYGPHTARVVSLVTGPMHVVQVDGVSHRIRRDEGGAVRAGMPAVVVSVAVEAGDTVAVGDPLVVLEAMKMETVARATFAGRVRSVNVIANNHVDAGDTLLQLDALEVTVPRSDGAGFFELPATEPPADGGDCHRVFETLRAHALGYDVEPKVLREVLGQQRALTEACASDGSTLVAHEHELLQLFEDLCALSARRPHPEDEGRSPQEHLLAFLRSPETAETTLPAAFVGRLRGLLARYGATSTARSPELAEALFRLYRAQLRLDELVPAVVAILDRRLGAASSQTDVPADEWAYLDRLVLVTDGRYQTVSDLARELRYLAFDRPLLLQSRAEGHAAADADLAALVADPTPAERHRHLAALVDNPQPLRPKLLEWYRRAGDDAVRAVAVEAALRRYYRIRPLEGVHVDHTGGAPLAVAEYDHDHGRVHVVALYGDLVRRDAIDDRLARHLADVPGDRQVVVDAQLWQDGPVGPIDELSVALRSWLDGLAVADRLFRVTLTITSDAEATTVHLSFRRDAAGFYEDVLYRNLHPMLAERLEIDAFANFRIRRLPTAAEDVYLFHAVALENPKDERLLALAEVRDLSAARSEDGRVVALPLLERIAHEALAAIRHEQSHRPPARRLLENRLILFVRPPGDIPMSDWVALANRLAPATRGLGIEKVVLRVRLVDPATGRADDAVLDVGNPEGRGIVVERRDGHTEPLRPLSPYRQKVLQVQRRGAVYPYELVRRLTPPPGVASDFPAGSFVEHDLGPDGTLEPVERPSGENTANVVVGVITNVTERYPEGMARVAILGDPSRGLGNLAEPECRRIIAALDLAERLRVPVEWYAVSSGALIAMDSGTENMDWIADVLRRIIAYTQDGGELNVIVTGINVGAQPYWNAEATMLMHTKGILVMTPESAMVLTGKGALDFSGGVSADDNFGIGGFERVMGPNGQAQYWAPDVVSACLLLFRHYEGCYVAPGERFPRPARSSDPRDRDVCASPHAATGGSDFTTVGEVFSSERNPERKKPFDIRSVMRAVTDQDHEPLERWGRMARAETGVVWDAHVGGIPVCLLGIESHTQARDGFIPADGPEHWSSGTLYPLSSKKIARAVNGASGNRPLVVLANLSGFDGSPESMRSLQLEYGAEIGRAVVNFDGPIVFVVISRYHGGAFVVFSKRLNAHMEIAAVEGSYASVIGGAPAAAVVFSHDVDKRTAADGRVTALDDEIAAADGVEQQRLRARRAEVWARVRSEKLGEVADEFARIHTIERAREVGSVDRIIPASELRAYVIAAVERGMARYSDTGGPEPASLTTVSTSSP